MGTYTAPVKDMLFVLNELAGLESLAQLPGYQDISPDLVSAVLDEAARFASGVLAPINRTGDQEGARWQDRAVTMPSGFQQAYQQFIEGGWHGLACNPEYGGQGMPRAVGAAVGEMWRSANVAFALCPMLTNGAIEVLQLCGTAEQKQRYLPRMVSGHWTGTMNLTEPQAGSDLAAIRCRAVPRDDGTYRIHGEKIFISYGDHDLAENTIHLVLARTPGAPEGVKGISLFLVPKFLLDEDGLPGQRNEVHCVSIEHKLGIHASPTCVMAFGEEEGATGILLGRENEGLMSMFIMMNEARFGVGMEGLALSEAAYQKAVGFARERVQGRAIEGSAGAVPIICHPDVRRMLMDMRSRTEAMRALCYVVAAMHDAAHAHPDAEERARKQCLVDLMTPVIKGWCTETGNAITYTGVQVHGGMGYVEETGAAQFMRDCRINTIYEGTTGIQANDLIFRKVIRDGGAAIGTLIRNMRQTHAEIADKNSDQCTSIAAALGRGIEALEVAKDHMLTHHGDAVRAVAVGAVPFLHLMGTVTGGWMMARSALVALEKISAGSTDPFYSAKLATAHYYADHAMAVAPGLAQEILVGGSSALVLDESLF